MRIGGIASGMDTEQMVKDLMRMERLRIDRFFQQEQRLKWRQDAFTNINRNMANFILDSRKAFGLTTMTSTGTMLSNSVNNLNWVKKAISSNESVVKATANANAMSGTHTVEVKQLAEVAKITSESLADKLDANLKFTENATFSITTKEGSQTFEITAGMSINDLVRNINNAKVGTSDKSLGVRASYDASLNKMMISTRETGSQNFITMDDIAGNFTADIFRLGNGAIESSINLLPLNGGEFNIKIGDVVHDIKVEAGKTVEQVAKQLNEMSALKGHIQAKAENGRLIVTATSNKTVEIQSLGDDILKELHVEAGVVKREITSGTIEGKYLKTGSFAIDVEGVGTYTIDVKENWTIKELVNAINKAEDEHGNKLNEYIMASHDGNKLTLTKKDGIDSSIKIQDIEGSADSYIEYLQIGEEITEDSITSGEIVSNYLATGEFKIKVGDNEETISVANMTLEDLAKALDDLDGINAIVNDNKLTISSNGEAVTIVNNSYATNVLKLKTGVVTGLAGQDESLPLSTIDAGSFKIVADGNEVIIAFDGGTLDELVENINSNKDLAGKVTAVNAEGRLQLVLTGAKTAEIKEIDGSDYASNKLKLSTGEEMTSQTGKDAEILFNGDLVSKSTNNFSVFGINLQLQSLQAEGAEPITIRVDTDVDSIFDKVKDFVDQYNKIIDEINGQVNQKHYRNFPPLTQEQKQAMSEKDIELWEEKAKSGLLRGDSALTRTLQSIRSGLYEKVEGVSGSYNHITQLGITTGAYQDGGKLVIDEQKLREAIGNDPEGVMDLLFKTPASGLEGKEKLQNTGLVNRIYDGLVDGMKEVIRHSGPGEDSNLLRNVRSNILIDFVTKQSSISLLDKDLNNLNSRIAREEDILRRREDRYWQQFSAMEKALSQMQNQSAWLMSQLGMGQ